MAMERLEYYRENKKMNKLLIVGLLFSILLFTGCTLQSGYTKDKLHGYDTGVLWNHVYLLNDHTTVYCFDDNRFIPLLEQAKNGNVTIEVDYEKYALRGALCSSGQEMETVVITAIKIVT